MQFASDATQPQPALSAEPPAEPREHRAARLIQAACRLRAALEGGQALDARSLREAMTEAFHGGDNEGAWVWKDAYEACEVAQLLFLRRHFGAMRRRAGSNAELLGMLGRLAALTPTHTRRSEESQQLQQFSTPLELGFVASLAAGITPADLVLEPSAGTGQLAMFAEREGASLALNEIAATRADLLEELFPACAVTRFNAEQIHDYLPESVRPSVILMNPPFSAALHVKGTSARTDLRHLRSALLRLGPGGRLVAITGANTSPSHPDVRDALQDLDVRVVLTAGISGALYRRHGTSIETRLTVIDRVPSPGWCSHLPCPAMAESAQELLDLVAAHVPPRLAERSCSGSAPTPACTTAAGLSPSAPIPPPANPQPGSATRGARLRF